MPQDHSAEQFLHLPALFHSKGRLFDVTVFQLFVIYLCKIWIFTLNVSAFWRHRTLRDEMIYIS